MSKRKNQAAVALGRKGGKVRSQAKTLACRANALKRWAKARSSALPAPQGVSTPGKVETAESGPGAS